MATVTVRNLTPKVVRSLKSLAKRNGRSMEQEVRELIEMYVGDKLSVMRQIEESWSRQARRPAADEVDVPDQRGSPVRVVVDTNVIAYYLLGTAAFVDEVKAFWSAVTAPIAPSSWEAELANVLWMSTRVA